MSLSSCHFSLRSTRCQRIHQHDFLTKKIILKQLLNQTSITIIDVQPNVFGDITEEFESICVVIDNLACVISFNIIHSPEHPVVLCLPWFELHNPKIDRRKRAILVKQPHISLPYFPNLIRVCHKIPTISPQ